MFLCINLWFLRIAADVAVHAHSVHPREILSHTFYTFCSYCCYHALFFIIELVTVMIVLLLEKWSEMWWKLNFYNLDKSKVDSLALYPTWLPYPFPFRVSVKWFISPPQKSDCSVLCLAIRYGEQCVTGCSCRRPGGTPLLPYLI